MLAADTVDMDDWVPCKEIRAEMLAMSSLRVKKTDSGFTIIELLVVIVIIAILTAIAIPVLLGERQRAHDAACKTLIRNAASTIEAGYTDARSYVTTVVGMRVADLRLLERAITFVVRATAATSPTATASTRTVNYTGTATTYSIGAVSASGKTFGMAVNKGTGGTRGVTYYVNGVVKRW
jgi:type IV pilus assembly protein PilA